MNFEKMAEAIGDTIKRQMESVRKGLSHIAGGMVELDNRLKAIEQRQPERGEKGDIGAAGERGADGAKGEKGDPGADGARGEPGPKGDIGERGIDGAAGVAGPQGEPGPQGPQGERGKDAEPIDLTDVARELASLPEIKTVLDLLTAEAVAKHFQTNPVRDGKDGAPGMNGKDGAAGPQGERGIDGAVGKDGAGIADLLIDRDGRLVASMTDGRTKNLGPVIGKDGAPGKDGADFTDCEIDYDGERTITVRGKGGEIVKHVAIPLDRGYWSEGKSAEQADILTHNGCAWIALRATKATPCHENKDDWRLMVRKGRDGTDGRNGRDLGPAPPVKLNGGGDA